MTGKEDDAMTERDGRQTIVNYYPSVYRRSNPRTTETIHFGPFDSHAEAEAFTASLPDKEWHYVTLYSPSQVAEALEDFDRYRSPIKEGDT